MLHEFLAKNQEYNSDSESEDEVSSLLHTTFEGPFRANAHLKAPLSDILTLSD